MLKKPPLARSIAAAAAVGVTAAMLGSPAVAAIEYEYTKLDQSQMTAVATDSVATAGEGSNGPLAKILDGDNTTYWHTQWTPNEDPLPHWFVVKLGDEAVDLGRVDLTPRQSSNGSGRVNGYQVFAVNSAGNCTEEAFADAEPVAKGNVAAEDKTSPKSITFTPVNADCVKVQYDSTWGGNNAPSVPGSLAEFNAFSAVGTEVPDPEPVPAPEIVVPDNAKEITDGTLIVRTHPDFPQVVDYRMGDAQAAGRMDAALTSVKIDGQVKEVQIGDVAVSADKTSVTYPITFTDTALAGASMDAVISVKDQVLTYKLTNIVDPKRLVNRIEIPGLDLVSVTSGDEGAELFVAKMSVDRTNSGDRHIRVNANASDVSERAWAAVAAQSDLAFGFETNSAGDQTAQGGGVPHGRFAYAVRSVGDAKIGTISSTQWIHRGGAVKEFTASDSEGIGVDPDPFIKVKVTTDANADSMINWQDGAIAARDVMHKPHGSEEVKNRVISRIPFNIVSQATHPFLRTLDDSKRISLATDNLGQQALLKGYQAEGHDSAQGDYGDHYNEKAGGLKDLKVLTSEGKNWNTTFGIHVNATESYSEAKAFSEELLRMPPQKAWGWMNQSYYMNNKKDLATGNVLKRLEVLRADFPVDSNLNWLYWDVYYPRGWEADRFAHEVANMGFRLASEWSDALALDNTWSHWANEERYGGQNNKGINSQLIRFMQNSYRDTFNPEPKLGNSNVVEFEGWTGHNNYNAFIRNVWERNLPTKFLQQSNIMKWEPKKITFKNGTVVTSDVKSVSGSEVPTNRTITYDGAEVYKTNGSYLLPWKDGGADRLYYWNPTNAAATWQLTDAWSQQSSLKLFKLTDTGREEVADIPVSDGQVNLPETDALTAYVLYPAGAVPEAKTPNWGQASNINDPGFFSGTLDAYQKTGEATVVKSDRANFQAQLGEGPSSISQEITVPAGEYSAWAWVEIEPGQMREVKVSAKGSGVKPQVNQEGKSGEAVTTIHASSAINATASDEKLRTFFQRVPVRFVTDGKPFTFSIAAGEGEAVVGIDDLRIVEKPAPADPNRTPETVLFDDFENVDDGYGPFVTGITNAGGDARTQLAEKHAPYSQSGWYAVTGNASIATEGDKYLDNVLEGEWSLMAHQENRGLILRTSNGLVPFKTGHSYRVSFDYQNGFADDYSVVLGTDQAQGKSWRHQILETMPLPQARGTGWQDAEGNAGKGTQKFTKEFVITDTNPIFIGITKKGTQTQGDLVIDNFRVEDLGARPFASITGEPVASDQANMRKMILQTKVQISEGDLSDVEHEVVVPDGWTIAPVEAGSNTASADKPSVAKWELTMPKNSEAGEVQFTGSWMLDGKEGSDEATLAVDPGNFPLLNPIGGSKLKVVDFSSQEEVGESAPNGFAEAAIDGDPNTFWHTQWQGGSPGFPHHITVQVKESEQADVTCTLTGFEYTHRSGSDNGLAKGYEIYVSDDGQTWGDPVATGNFANIPGPQVVDFDPVEASYVKFVETSSMKGNNFGGAAEIRVGGTCTGATDPEEPIVPEVPVGQGIIRVGGENRYVTSAEMAKLFEDGASTVYVATGQNYPDALAAAAVAGHEGAPIVLVNSKALNAEAANAIKALDPARIVVVGGTLGVSKNVESALKALNVADQVDRIGGKDRYDTAANLALDSFASGAPVVYLASGSGYADALSASAAAAHEGGPVLLVGKDKLPASTINALKEINPEKIVIVGGMKAVPAKVGNQAANLVGAKAQRYAGANRYATAQVVAENVFGVDGVSFALVASGKDFPDALSGAAVAAAKDGPVLLTEPRILSGETATALRVIKPQTVMIAGGKAAVSDNVKGAISTITGLPILH